MKVAAAELGVWRLTGCTVYVTLEPCIMCAGLMHQARVDRCVFGAPDPKAGALGTLYSIHEDKRLNHTFDVKAGVLSEERNHIAGFLQGASKETNGAAVMQQDEKQNVHVKPLEGSVDMLDIARVAQDVEAREFAGMGSLKLVAPAKVNLYLNVKGVRVRIP